MASYNELEFSIWVDAVQERRLVEVLEEYKSKGWLKEYRVDSPDSPLTEKYAVFVSLTANSWPCWDFDTLADLVRDIEKALSGDVGLCER